MDKALFWDHGRWDKYNIKVKSIYNKNNSNNLSD